MDNLWEHGGQSKIENDRKDNPESHKFDTLALIAEDEKTICKNISVSKFYTFLHADFEDVEFYAARQYVNLTR